MSHECRHLTSLLVTTENLDAKETGYFGLGRTFRSSFITTLALEVNVLIMINYFLLVFRVCPESIQLLCNMKNRDIYWKRYKKHYTEDSDTSVPFKVGNLVPHTLLPAPLPQFKILQNPLLESPSAAPHIFLNIINVLKSLPFQRWFEFWEKPEVTEHSILAVGGPVT